MQIERFQRFNYTEIYSNLSLQVNYGLSALEPTRRRSPMKGLR